MHTMNTAINKTDKMRVEKPSVQSLYIKLFFNDIELATGTGFIAEHKDKYYLITARHNLTGRHHDTDECLLKVAATPNIIEIYHHKKNALGSWFPIKKPLYADNENCKLPLWIEHPTLEKKIDIVAFPLDNNQNVDYIPYSLKHDRTIAISPTKMVSVIGFPFGLNAGVGGYMPIWVTGFVASEPKMDYRQLPVFLIDCHTREGLSGSPVIIHTQGPVTMDDGSTVMFSDSITNFLGIYSGRIHKESDIGMVWKLAAIQELVDSIT